LQSCMSECVGIFRTQADLQAGLARLLDLKARAARARVEGSRLFNPGWHLVRDVRNLILVSEAITRSALLRKESRGAHSRLDFPTLDPALGKVNMCARRRGSEMEVVATALPEMPAELRSLFEPAQVPVG